MLKPSSTTTPNQKEAKMTIKIYLSNLKRELRHPRWARSPYFLAILATDALTFVWHPMIYAFYAALAAPIAILLFAIVKAKLFGKYHDRPGAAAS